MNINNLSINQYNNLSEEEKQDFYEQIILENPRAKNTTLYKTAINCAKQAHVPNQLTKQKNGHLTFIAPLHRKDKKITSLYFLTVCDCGNWQILEAANFRQEKTIQCINCSLSKLTTMKDISGKIFGQLQAIKPTDKRSKDGSVYWLCQCIDCGHQQIVNKISLRESLSHLCAVCGEKSKGEYKIATLLKNHNITFEKEKTFNNCIFPDTKAHARFDFYVNNQYIIEVDGQHHFFPIKYGPNISDKQAQKLYQKVLEHDRFKNEYCFTHNIPIIRIPYISLDNLTYEDIIIDKSKFLLYNNIEKGRNFIIND